MLYKKEIKGKYIKCYDCGKFGNAVNSKYWDDNIGCWIPTEECPHCGSECPSYVIKNKKLCQITQQKRS